jgi:protein-histidine pros-kinase
MKLLFKFNLVLLVLFAIGIAATGFICWDLLQRNAREEVYERARLLMDDALAVRKYTLEEITPLLATQQKYTFLPQAVSFYSAKAVLKNFLLMNPDYRDYGYREATTNPTNPDDRPQDWERDIIENFRNSGSKTRVFGQRDTPTGPTLFIAQPLIIENPKCLECHSTVEAAPKPMIDMYGSANGFGWKMNQVVGVQVVSVPLAVPQARAQKAFTVFMVSLAAVLVAVALVLNLVLWWMFVRPVTQISALADRVSLGAVDAPDFVAGSRDEIGSLAQSLSRMRRSLAQAIKMLET